MKQNVLIQFPDDADGRKQHPVTSGVLDYFPAAIAEVARISKAGNDQHNPGQPLHWARAKSRDHADCIGRHLIQRGTVDVDGGRHSAKMAWRALALLQEELEAEAGFDATGPTFEDDLATAAVSPADKAEELAVPYDPSTYDAPIILRQPSVTVDPVIYPAPEESLFSRVFGRRLKDLGA